MSELSGGKWKVGCGADEHTNGGGRIGPGRGAAVTRKRREREREQREAVGQRDCARGGSDSSGGGSGGGGGNGPD